MSNPNAEKAIELLSVAIKELQEAEGLMIAEAEKEPLFKYDSIGLATINEMIKERITCILETVSFAEELQQSKIKRKNLLAEMEMLTGLARKKDENGIDYLMRISSDNKNELEKKFQAIKSDIFDSVVEKTIANKMKKDKPIN